MYGSNVQTIKEVQVSQGTLKIQKSVQHSHGFLKSGRGTIKTRISYLVVIINLENDLYLTLHRTTKKSDAIKIYKLILKLGLETYSKVVEDAAELVHEFNKAN